MNRAPLAGVAGPERLEEASEVDWNLVVVGGGAIGTAVARAAARAGLATLLLEQRDFGWGTTSRSTRLIHGGLRYLPMFDFGLVREDLRERETLLRTAAHLVKPLEMLYPQLEPFLGSRLLGRLRLRTGMIAYDVLSFDKALPRHHLVDRSGALRLAPSLDRSRLDGGAVFYDAQLTWAERLCVEQAVDAAEHGATCLTHVAVERFERRHGAISGVLARAEPTGDGPGPTVAIRAGRVINTAGPWVDDLIEQSGAGPRLQQLSRGIHLVGPRVEVFPLIAPLADESDRVIFVLPWAGATLVGTTDTPFRGDPARPGLEQADVDTLLGHLTELLPAAATWRPWYGISGIRSLGDATAIGGGGLRPVEETSSVSRRAFVVEHSRWRAHGLVSLAGGKLTGHRAIAGQLLHTAFPRLRRAELLPDDPLPGAVSVGEPRGEGRRPGSDPGSEPSSRLVELYGSRAHSVAPAGAEEALPGTLDVTMAELEHAVGREGARTLSDVIQRRVMVGHGPDLGSPAAAALAAPLGELLGWDTARRAAELEGYAAEVDERRLPDASPPAPAFAEVAR
jgi:glycerol-3-phosphate dehydrogenase